MIPMLYWMNSDTGKVTARDIEDPPYGDLWFEISADEYNEITGAVSSAYVQEFDDFTDADPGL